MALITINGVSLDPLAHASSLASANLVSADASHSNYVLVQTKAPLTDNQRKKLEDLGVVVHEYVSENTYLGGYPPTDLAAIRALPFVAWADVYLRGFKVNPALRQPMGLPQGHILPQAAAPAHSHTLHTVDVVLHDDVDPSSAGVKEKIARAVGLDPDDLKPGRNKIRLNVQERALDDLAAIDEVRQIEEVPEVKLRNNVAREILKAPAVLNGTRFEGAGQVVAVADTGFDRGKTNGVHPAFTGRVAKLYALGRPGKANDPHGHGTHVCGSVLGNGTSASMGGAIQGTAPAATLVVQSLLDATGALNGIPNDLHDLFGPPYTNDGARVHTNSWGATTPGLPYNQSSREIDDFVWSHPDCVICFAAGNDGSDGNGDGSVDAASLGAEAAAKNCITVGASENDRPDIGATYGFLRPTSFARPPLNGDAMANHPEGMAAFSSRGPTKEGRVKPDVVAPGTSILSTRSRDALNVPTLFGTSSDQAFFFDSGTSMATPLVAGCVAALRECLVKNGTPNPTAALIKALLINGAVDLAGQYSPSEAGPGPNPNSGFGRVNLSNSVITPGDPNAGFVLGDALKQGESKTMTLKVPAGGGAAGRSLKVTLVWTDPPGDRLQNDLDLIVQAGAAERHGNMGTSKDFDRVNNVEQVVWKNVPAGNVKVTVKAFRITKFPQAYALVWRLA